MNTTEINRNKPPQMLMQTLKNQKNIDFNYFYHIFGGQEVNALLVVFWSSEIQFCTTLSALA